MKEEALISEDNLLVIVPARRGSKRLPEKNHLRIADRSLLGRIEDTLSQSIPNASVLFTSDDEILIEEARSYGWYAPFVRPAHLADDTAKTIDVVAHALDHWVYSGFNEPSAVLLLQTTSPFRTPELINTALKTANEDESIDNVIAVSELHVGAENVLCCNEASHLTPITTEVGQAFVPNGALYLSRTAALRKTHSFIAGTTCGIAVSSIEATDVDTPLDLQWSVFIARHQTSDEYREISPSVFVPGVPEKVVSNS